MLYLYVYLIISTIIAFLLFLGFGYFDDADLQNTDLTFVYFLSFGWPLLALSWVLIFPFIFFAESAVWVGRKLKGD